MGRARIDTDECAIRLATPRDRERFLDLYETVRGTRTSAAWFDWRFRENPHADGIEMVVAEHGSRLVGAEPLLPFALTGGGETVPVRQPVDWIVHPEYRGRGVFARMTERLLSAYTDRGALLFDFPSDAVRTDLQRFDWTELGPLGTRYRVQRPPALAAAADATAVWRLVARAATPFARTALAAADRVADAGASVPVDRTPGVDTRAIRAVYIDTAPDAIHVPRTRPHVDWRYANPRWTTTTYVAHDAGRPRATVVVARDSDDPPPVTAGVLDVQPMTTRRDRAPAVAAALDAALRDNRDAAVVVAASRPFPRVFRRRGFVSDRAASLSRIATPATLAVRPLGDDATTALDTDAFDPANWVLALGDRGVD